MSILSTFRILAANYLCRMTALQIVQQYYQCFNTQNWEGMLALLSENIRHEVNQGEPRIGLDLYRVFLKHMDDCYVALPASMSVRGQGRWSSMLYGSQSARW